ncbi:MAG: peptide transporter, partial [Sulfurospirillaceae bacterium]|nr:peptide transporter [Sulfurospirillaceae bacterium]
FSYIDLMSGNSLPKPLFHLFQNVVQDEEILVLSQNIFVDKKRALVNLGENSYKLKTLITTSYEDEFKKQISPLHEDGELTLIYMSSYNSFLLIENELLNSTFIKLFVLEEYDERFFKPISLKPWAKIYKIL